MSTQSIAIKTNPVATADQPAIFAPRNVVAFAGDNLTWHNDDSQNHWPAPGVGDRTGFFQYQIPPGSESRGDLALGPYSVQVLSATNAPAVVLTLNGSAPASGTTITLAYAAPAPAPAQPSPWAAASGAFVATNVNDTSCSIPLDTSTFGAFDPATSGSISFPMPYTLSYVCALHPAETGTILVNPQQ